MSASGEHVEIVVIGAGVAGLAAAGDLHQAGFSLRVIEARDRIGGRILTIRDADTPMPIELGAEFVHGRAPELYEVIDAASLTAIDIAGSRWTPTRTTLAPLDDFWEQVERVMHGLKRFARRRDRSFDEFLATRPGGRPLTAARRLVREYVEGFHAADPMLVSAQALAENGSPGDDTRERRLARIIDGYDRVPAWLSAPIVDRIQLSSVVTDVEWEQGQVSVHVQRGNESRQALITARAAIVAVPLGVLQARADEAGAIRFRPALDEKKNALRHLASGSVVRVVFRFSERFWTSAQFAKRHHSDDLDTLSFLHGHDGRFPTWWTAYPSSAALVVGWCGGPRATEVSRVDADQIVGQAIDSLADQMKMPRRRLSALIENAWTHDWEHDPFARGAYSYQMVDGAESPSALARPLRRTIFFAGEAAETSGGTGTVHGAIATGRRAAKQVMRALKDNRVGRSA